MGEGFGPVLVAAEAWEAMVRHALAERPRECCGLLLGPKSGNAIELAWQARNQADVATRFLVDPRDHFDAIRAARARGWDVIGAYHSHPRSPARPSPTDLEESCGPAWLNVIVSLQEEPPAVAAFYYVDGEPQPIPLRPEL